MCKLKNIEVTAAHEEEKPQVQKQETEPLFRACHRENEECRAIEKDHDLMACTSKNRIACRQYVEVTNSISRQLEFYHRSIAIQYLFHTRQSSQVQQLGDRLQHRDVQQDGLSPLSPTHHGEQHTDQ